MANSNGDSSGVMNGSVAGPLTLRHEHPETMRAVMFEGKALNVSVKSIPKPKIVEPEDAIVRITSAAICGTDLHIYRGFLGSTNPPWSLGHEAIGIVTEVGLATTAVKVGDRVIIPDGTDDGKFTLEPQGIADTGMFGFGPDYGNLGGCQGTAIQASFSTRNLANHMQLNLFACPRRTQI